MSLQLKNSLKRIESTAFPIEKQASTTRKGLNRLWYKLANLVVESRQKTQIFHAQLFFGMSIPSGHAISLSEWNNFIDNHITPRFDGFNIADSMGFWQGQPERAKIVTIVLSEQQITEVEAIASDYATLFHQDSVMLILRPVAKWEFVPGENASKL